MPIRPPDRTLRPADGNLRDDGPISPIIGGGSSSILAKRKRSQVAVACDACRKRKGKCDVCNMTIKQVLQVSSPLITFLGYATEMWSLC